MSAVQIDGMKELERTIQQLGKLPQKCVTKSARLGAREVLKAAKRLAPVKTGQLKRGIRLYGEKLRGKKGKKVYQVVMNSNMNDVFVKMTKDGTKRYYYPASMEYGFRTRSGRKTMGKRFLRGAADETRITATKKMVDVLASEIDKLR